MSEKEQNPQDAQELKELHKFWSEQPVVKTDETRDEFGCYIDMKIPVTAPPAKPVTLPAGFTWCDLDPTNPTHLTEIYKFLSLNYVEDSEHRFRFLLSEQLLSWALTIPGFIKDWIFGVRTKTGALAGFISGVPMDIKLNGKVEPWCSVNFMCVHSHLRKRKMAPVLIFELHRRVRLHNVYRAVFSGADVPSKPFAKAIYKHRPLNLKKLSQIGFYPIAPNRMAAAQKRFMIPKLVHGNVRPFRSEEDTESLLQLLKETGENFKFDVEFTPETISHFFTPRKDVLYTYVIPGPTGLSAMFSFYIMNWSVLNDNTVSEVRSAYIWYTATKVVDMNSLIADLLYKAVNDAKADIANSLTIMGLKDALTTNKFEAGNKELEYYSYNFAVPDIEDSELRFLFI